MMKTYLILTGMIAAVTSVIAQQQQNPGGQDQSPPPPGNPPASVQTNLPPGLERREQLPPGLGRRDQLPPGLAKRTNQFNTNTIAGTTNVFGTNLPPTGRTNGLGRSTNQFGTDLPPTGRNEPNETAVGTGAAAQVRVQAFTVADQSIATQIREVLVAETVLLPILPRANIQVREGTVILGGEVQCGAERVLIQNLIQQRVPNVRVNNMLRVRQAIAPTAPPPGP